jgi:branched-chain amino acid aminotransferase
MADWADWIWLNGRLVRATEASVSVFDRSFLLGDGLFETMRATGGRLFRPERHLSRLERGAARLRMALPAAADELLGALRETVRANHLEDAALRLTISRGNGPPGLGLEGTGPPVCMIAARPFQGYPHHWYDPGAASIISSVVKNEQSLLAGLKTTSYVEHVVARAEAMERGADEALLLNTRGHLVEGSGSNLFAVIAGELSTPDVESGCLPGVTREAVLKLARESGLAIREGTLLLAELIAAAEAFLTNSLLGVAPLVRVDGRSIGPGQPGPVTRKLAERYRWLVVQEAE